MRIGIVGGTGIYGLTGGAPLQQESVDTPFGLVEVAVGDHAGHSVAFLARHGASHNIPPHRINYLANIDALRRLGCRCIIASNAVGGICPDAAPGDLVLPDQFIDFTRRRPLTFYDGGTAGVRHVDFTEPYCPALRARALDVIGKDMVRVHPQGTYVCTEGPRFETPAEIRMFGALGADVVGMTGVPEVVLAREAGMCYLSICIVTNFAAGINPEPLTEGDVGRLMASRTQMLVDLLLELVASMSDQWECACTPEGT